jgi:hypothetical protein
MRKWTFCFALILLGCDGNDVTLGVTPDTGQAALPAGGDWTARLTVPLPLNDVVWDGQAFIAVGYEGTILTSVDGIDWVARESPTDQALLALAAFDSDIYAVGDFGVFLSTDHGETWAVKARPEFIGTAVAANSSHIVVIGIVPDMGFPRITISEDSGATWQTAGFSWSGGDLIYRDGLFVSPEGLGVIVSPDGKQWSEIAVGAEDEETHEAIIHDGNQFFVARGGGRVYSSFDAFNWTEVSAPVVDIEYTGGASNGTQLVLVGGSVGISSNDGGASWNLFGVNDRYESKAVASGNGRFVTVGRLMHSDEGVIYTTD